jgi:rhodanese-related sulfurtransferase
MIGKHPEDPTMPLKKGIKALVAEAEAQVDNLAVEQAKALHGRDDVLFVDLRDVRELWREGTVPGSVHAPRGMLEFWVDPDSPYHKDVFASGKKMVFFCQSGWRSALAAKTVQDMGLDNVAHIKGGFSAWKTAGFPVEAKSPPPPKG